jgi:acetylornithine deacetylase
MNDILATTLQHLRALVSHDTQNPPRAISTDGIFEYVRAQLSGFVWQLADHGAGAVGFFALRGNPRVLFNVHLDTVPAGPTWTRDPFALQVTGERAVGLGACDIKGAAAALLTAAAHTTGDMALLFTSDEEANDARCVSAFLAQKRPFETIVVAEPTRCEAVLAHRGISSGRIAFAGRAGHSSGDTALGDSAIHQAVRWGARSLAHVESLQHERFGGLTGLRFNIGRIEGGIKTNVIAPSAEVRFGFRPLPSMDSDALLAKFRACAEIAPAEFAETFRGPPLPAGNVAAAEERRLAARDFADGFGVPIAHAVDFWTEASLFSHAGYSAIVLGCGDIAQAHSADEFVELAQLQKITEIYMNIIDHGVRDGAGA